MRIKAAYPYKRTAQAMARLEQLIPETLERYDQSLERFKLKLGTGKINSDVVLSNLEASNRSVILLNYWHYRNTADKVHWYRAMRGLDVVRQVTHATAICLHLKPDELYTPTIEGLTLELTRYKGMSLMGWVTELCLAVALRAQQDVEKLLDIDPRIFSNYESKFTKKPEYPHLVHQLMRALILKDQPIEPLMQRYQHDFDEYQRFERDKLSFLPWYYAVKGDQAAYEQSIRELTQAHIKFDKKSDLPLWDNHIMTVFPGDLIAAACVAYDTHQWRLAHTNDYIPEWWYDLELRKSGDFKLGF